MLTSLDSTSGAFIVRMMYGIDIKDENDKFMLASEQAMATILKVSAPVSFAFDALPICKFSIIPHICGLI